ncbi:MAG: HAMP domain-containing sensor histidine kinase [Betaproteobacteria bacterium]
MAKRLALYEFLAVNQEILINRCRAKVAQRPAPKATPDELQDGIPLFLTQLIKTLRMEQTAQPGRSREVSGPEDGTHALSEIGEGAARHGLELLQHGFTVDQVVHDYGDLCQAITDLAFELNMPFETDEFRTLNRCLDNGIAAAVTEFTYRRDVVVADHQAQALNERLGFFAHELRNLLSNATMALAAIKAGNVGLSGATGAVLDRSLVGLRNLIDRSLEEVRMTAGMPVQSRRFSVADFIAEVNVSARLEAQIRESGFTAARVDQHLAVEADRDMLLSAVGNLLQNAFKFTRPDTEVSLTAYAVADRILIEVEDHCGGLPPGDVENMFRSFTQNAADKTGLGLGLSISRRSVEANGGILSVRDIPGSGCVFTIDLPRYSLAHVDGITTSLHA